MSPQSTRLPLLVQGSDAAHATKLLARSATSPLRASALTTARPQEEVSSSSPASLLSLRISITDRLAPGALLLPGFAAVLCAAGGT